MKIAIKFFQKSFGDEDAKEAYLKACKWVAKYVVSKEVEIGETFHRIVKDTNANYPTFILELYAALDESEIKSSHCEVCKQFHKSFYINQEYNCNACKMMAYRTRIEQKLKVKQDYRKTRLGYLLEGNKVGVNI